MAASLSLLCLVLSVSLVTANKLAPPPGRSINATSTNDDQAPPSRGPAPRPALTNRNPALKHNPARHPVLAGRRPSRQSPPLQSVRLQVSEAGSVGRTLDLHPGSPLVLTHRINLLPPATAGSCACGAEDLSALRERLERLEAQLSELRGRCGGDGPCCTAPATGPGCLIAPTCPEDCNDQGRCEGGRCVCFPGFSGPDCSIRSCPGNCSNRGQCVNGKCVCDTGFTGTDCSATSCPANCNSRGQCVNGKCVCDTGFTGTDCSATSCPANCNSRGQCVNGKCVCDTGFTGTDCSTRSCPANCNNRGQCVNGKCVCDTGFTGTDCSTRSCPANCNSRGQCVNGKCVCDTGFTGTDCSATSCPANCNSRGQCVNGKCVCDTGFTGTDCSATSCPANCNSRGQCVNGKCVCDTGFTGTDCSTRSCPANCNNRGQCVNGKCVCDTGFTGTDCSATSCPANCNSRGQCVNGKCVCDTGFTGTDCSTRSCPSNCNNRGQCVNGKCVCDTGFTGTDCSTRSCPSNCNNRGQCVNGKCVCDTGFTGTDCSTRSCPSNCNNRGQCVNGKCVCDTGFTGTDCSTRSCAANCNNRGQCVNGKCVCDTGFTGTDCSTRSCPANCNNRGQCVNGKCVCDTGFTGTDCSARSCPANCNNRGQCVNGKCVCDTGFTGMDCSTSSCRSDCSNHGHCLSGRCVCESGFTGNDCSLPLCPGDCSGHGRCVEGECSCDPGYTGLDCGAVVPVVSKFNTNNITDSSVTLTWTLPPKPVDTYHITLISKKEGDQKVTSKVRGDLSSYTQTGLAPAQDYRVSIRGERANKLGPESIAEFKTLISGPKNVRVVKTTSSSVLIQWDRSVSQIDRYRLTFSPSDGGEGLTGQKTISPERETTLINGLEAGLRYDVTLTAEQGRSRSLPATIQATPAKATKEKTVKSVRPVFYIDDTQKGRVQAGSEGNATRNKLIQKQKQKQSHNGTRPDLGPAKKDLLKLSKKSQTQHQQPGPGKKNLSPAPSSTSAPGSERVKTDRGRGDGDLKKKEGEEEEEGEERKHPKRVSVDVKKPTERERQGEEREREGRQGEEEEGKRGRERERGRDSDSDSTPVPVTQPPQADRQVPSQPVAGAAGGGVSPVHEHSAPRPSTPPPTRTSAPTPGPRQVAGPTAEPRKTGGVERDGKKETGTAGRGDQRAIKIVTPKLPKVPKKPKLPHVPTAPNRTRALQDPRLASTSKKGPIVYPTRKNFTSGPPDSSTPDRTPPRPGSDPATRQPHQAHPVPAQELTTVVTTERGGGREEEKEQETPAGEKMEGSPSLKAHLKKCNHTHPAGHRHTHTHTHTHTETHTHAEKEHTHTVTQAHAGQEHTEGAQTGTHTGSTGLRDTAKLTPTGQNTGKPEKPSDQSTPTARLGQQSRTRLVTLELDVAGTVQQSKPAAGGPDTDGTAGQPPVRLPEAESQAGTTMDAVGKDAAGSVTDPGSRPTGTLDKPHSKAGARRAGLVVGRPRQKHPARVTVPARAGDTARTNTTDMHARKTTRRPQTGDKTGRLDTEGTGWSPTDRGKARPKEVGRQTAGVDSGSYLDRNTVELLPVRTDPHAFGQGGAGVKEEGREGVRVWEGGATAGWARATTTTTITPTPIPQPGRKQPPPPTAASRAPHSPISHGPGASDSGPAGSEGAALDDTEDPVQRGAQTPEQKREGGRAGGQRERKEPAGEVSLPQRERWREGEAGDGRETRGGGETERHRDGEKDGPETPPLAQLPPYWRHPTQTGQGQQGGRDREHHTQTFPLNPPRAEGRDRTAARNSTPAGNGVLDREGTLLRNRTLVRNRVLVKNGTLVRNGVLVKNGTLVRNGMLVKNGTLVRNGVLVKNGTLVRNGMLVKNGTLVRNGMLVKNGTLVRNGVLIKKGMLVRKGALDRESTPPRNVELVSFWNRTSHVLLSSPPSVAPTLLAPPPGPGALQVQNLSSSGFLLLWDAPPGLYHSFTITRTQLDTEREGEGEEEAEEGKEEEEEGKGSKKDSQGRERGTQGGRRGDGSRDRGKPAGSSEGTAQGAEKARPGGAGSRQGRVVKLVSGSTRSLSIWGLQPQTHYAISLFGTAHGRDSPTQRLTVTTGPAPPSQLMFSNVSDSSVLVSWLPPRSSVSSFKITYIHTDEGEPHSVSVSGQQSSVSLTSLTPGSTYKVSVLSVLGLEESDPITGVVVTVPDPPSDLRVVNVTDSRALLLWRPALVNVDRYVIVYRAQDEPEVSVSSSGNSVELQLKGLQGETLYSVTVTSLRGREHSPPASTSFTTASGVVARGEEPRDLTANQVKPRSAMLSWKPPRTAVSGYWLTYQTDRQETQEVTLDPGVTQHKLVGLVPESQYTVRLRALRGEQHSADSTAHFTTGSLRFPFPVDCSQELLNGMAESGETTVYPGGQRDKPLRVYCDMETDGGGWIVFQRRMNGKTNFFRFWKDYRDGFGNLTEEFWLGNKALHLLTREGAVSLRVDLRAEGQAVHALYSSFNVTSEHQHYRLTVGGYSGTAGDALQYHDGRPFSTRDRDPQHQITRCAMSYKGGWWYKNCHYANLNGLYNTHRNHQGVIWTNWKGNNFSIAFTEMKLRPAGFSPSSPA